MTEANPKSENPTDVLQHAMALIADADDQAPAWVNNSHMRPVLTDEERRSLTAQRERLFEEDSEFKPTKREEIVGIDNILGEIDEIIHWLRHSHEYGAYKARLQPGAVFAGVPGTGKTLVSRWIATASGARFVNVRDFTHEGALLTDTDIRELFKLARAWYARDGRPIILFWDEFENSAQERDSERCTQEGRAVVSQLTAELDGINGKNEGILLLGCTNYLSSIDHALLRRGRMGVQIEFHPPDRAGKEKILGYYLNQMTTMPNIDLHTLSYFFPANDTAADIEEACVEAWRRAVRRSIDGGAEPILAQPDLVEVFIKQLVGPPTTFTLPEEEQLPIAIHECGHAIAALAYDVPLRLITCQPGKKALGRVIVDTPREYVGTVVQKLNYMRMLIGGMAAERTAGLPEMLGTTNDIAKVNATAEHLVTNLAAGKRVGLFDMTALNRVIGYSPISPQVSEGSLIAADADVNSILTLVEMDTAKTLADVGKDHLVAVATIVNERVTMTGHEFHDLFIEICGKDPRTLAT